MSLVPQLMQPDCRPLIVAPSNSTAATHQLVELKRYAFGEFGLAAMLYREVHFLTQTKR